MADEDAGRPPEESSGRASEDEAGRSRNDETTRTRTDDAVGVARDADRAPLDERAPRDDRGNDDAGTGFSFSLPPILLPEMRFPDRVRLLFPAPDPPEKPTRSARIRTSRVLLVVALADGLDVALALLIEPGALPWVRAAAGTLLSVVLVGFPGVLYAWELLAIFGGFGLLALAPTATALVLARLLYSQ